MNGIAALSSGLVFLYGLAGIAMAYWISAVPGNSPERVRFNLVFWLFASVISLVSTMYFARRWIRRSGE